MASSRKLNILDSGLKALLYSLNKCFKGGAIPESIILCNFQYLINGVRTQILLILAKSVFELPLLKKDEMEF